MNSMVEHLLNQNLPDHERLGVTPAAQPAEVREAVARFPRFAGSSSRGSFSSARSVDSF